MKDQLDALLSAELKGLIGGKVREGTIVANWPDKYTIDQATYGAQQSGAC